MPPVALLTEEHLNALPEGLETWAALRIRADFPCEQSIPWPADRNPHRHGRPCAGRPCLCRSDGGAKPRHDDVGCSRGVLVSVGLIATTMLPCCYLAMSYWI